MNKGPKGMYIEPELPNEAPQDLKSVAEEKLKNTVGEIQDVMNVFDLLLSSSHPGHLSGRVHKAQKYLDAKYLSLKTEIESCPYTDLAQKYLYDLGKMTKKGQLS